MKCTSFVLSKAQIYSFGPAGPRPFIGKPQHVGSWFTTPHHCNLSSVPAIRDPDKSVGLPTDGPMRRYGFKSFEFGQGHWNPTKVKTGKTTLACVFQRGNNLAQPLIRLADTFWHALHLRRKGAHFSDWLAISYQLTKITSGGMSLLNPRVQMSAVRDLLPLECRIVCSHPATTRADICSVVFIADKNRVVIPNRSAGTNGNYSCSDGS